MHLGFNCQRKIKNIRNKKKQKTLNKFLKMKNKKRRRLKKIYRLKRKSMDLIRKLKFRMK